MTEMTLMTNLVPLPLLPPGRLQAHPVSFAVSWHCAHVTCLWPVECELHGIGFSLSPLPFLLLPHLHPLKTKRMSHKERLHGPTKFPCGRLLTEHWESYDEVAVTIWTLSAVTPNIPRVCHMWVSGLHSAFHASTLYCTLSLSSYCSLVPRLPTSTSLPPKTQGYDRAHMNLIWSLILIRD